MMKLFIFLATVLALVNGEHDFKLLWDYCGLQGHRCNQEMGMENAAVCRGIREPCLDNPPYEIKCAVCLGRNSEQCFEAMNISKDECDKKICFAEYIFNVETNDMFQGEDPKLSLYECLNKDQMPVQPDKLYFFSSFHPNNLTFFKNIRTAYETNVSVPYPKCTRCSCMSWNKQKSEYNNCLQYTGKCPGGFCVKCEEDGTTPMPGFWQKHTKECAKYDGTAPKCTNCSCKSFTAMPGFNNGIYSDCKQYTTACTGHCVKCEEDGTTPMPGFWQKHTQECAKYEGEEASLKDLLRALLF